MPSQQKTSVVCNTVWIEDEHIVSCQILVKSRFLSLVQDVTLSSVY